MTDAKKLSIEERLERDLETIRQDYFAPDEVLRGIGPNLQPPDGLVASSTQLRQIAVAFVANLNRATGAALMPFLISQAASADRHIALIRNTWELTDHEAMGGADVTQALRHFFGDPPNQQLLRDEAVLFLRRALVAHETELTKRAPHDLLHQCTVQCWTAFEVLTNDLLAHVCEQHPEKVAARILSDEGAKKRFADKKWTLEEIAENGFNLSRCLSENVLGRTGLSDFPSIHRALLALVPQTKNVVSDDDFRHLELLAERRHIIVHRGAVMDRRFLERFRKLPREAAGLTLPVSSETLELDLRVVRSVGQSVLEQFQSEFVAS